MWMGGVLGLALAAGRCRPGVAGGGALGKHWHGRRGNKPQDQVSSQQIADWGRDGRKEVRDVEALDAD